MTLPPVPDPKQPAPHLSHAPWAGFTAREHKRDAALAICPSLRCRRLQACVGAHDDLYCQRTHNSHAAYLAGLPKRPTLLNNFSAEELEFFRLDVADKFAEAKERHDALVVRWKAGEFDALYGPWRARGVLMYPPEKQYVVMRKGGAGPKD